MLTEKQATSLVKALTFKWAAAQASMPVVKQAVSPFAGPLQIAQGARDIGYNSLPIGTKLNMWLDKTTGPAGVYTPYLNRGLAGAGIGGLGTLIASKLMGRKWKDALGDAGWGALLGGVGYGGGRFLTDQLGATSNPAGRLSGQAKDGANAEFVGLVTDPKTGKKVWVPTDGKGNVIVKDGPLAQYRGLTVTDVQTEARPLGVREMFSWDADRYGAGAGDMAADGAMTAAGLHGLYGVARARNRVVQRRDNLRQTLIGHLANNGTNGPLDQKIQVAPEKLNAIQGLASGEHGWWQKRRLSKFLDGTWLLGKSKDTESRNAAFLRGAIKSLQKGVKPPLLGPVQLPSASTPVVNDKLVREQRHREHLDALVNMHPDELSKALHAARVSKGIVGGNKNKGADSGGSAAPGKSFARRALGTAAPTIAGGIVFPVANAIKRNIGADRVAAEHAEAVKERPSAQERATQD